MALVVKDRVRESSTTTGTGAITLAGAYIGFVTFASSVSDGSTVFYGIHNTSPGYEDEWEVGYGTYSAGTLTRDTLYSSSTGSTVDFSTGTKEVFITYPSEAAVFEDNSGNVTVTGKLTVGTEPVDALDVATKGYVDNAVAAALHYHDPVRAESPANLTATYNNGTAGVGATLTNAGTQAALVLDGITLNVADRVLIYTQTDATQNGVYTVTNVGSGSTNWVLTRATDADSYSPASPTSLGQGDAFYVQEGDTAAGESYVCTTQGTITFGTTDITFSQFAATPAYTGTGNINVTGQVISLTGVIDETNGGTGSSSYTTGDILYASGATTLAQLPGNTTTTAKYLTQTGTGSASAAPTWTALAASATTDTTNASNISSGTLPSARISGSYTGITGVGVLTAGTWSASTVGAAYGGTGLTSYTIGDIVYATGTTTIGKLADIATGNVLLSGGVGAAPQYGKVGLTTHVSGVLPITNGGTNSNTADGGFNNLAPSQTGNSGKFLTTNGSTTSWGTPTTANNGAFTVNTSTGLSGGGQLGTADQASATSITLTNTDRGSQQNIFKNIAVSGQSTVVADTNDDTLTLVAGSNVTITTNAATDTITFAASQPSVGNGNFTVNTGSGLTGGALLGTANQSADTSVTISHADTSTQASVNNSGTTVIQDVILDGFGHVTGLASVDLSGTFGNYVLKSGDTMSGDLIISKADARLRLYDSTGTSGNNPFIEFDTTATQGIKLELNVYDGELPVSGYGMVVGPSTTNSQFPTTGTLTFNVLGEMYAGGTTLGSLNKVFHDGYHPNADRWTTQRTNTVTLTGDVTGSGNALVDGSGNWTVSIPAVVVNDSHSHSNYVLKSGDTMTGVLTINSASDAQLQLTSPDSWTGIGFNDSAPAATDYIWHNGINSTFAIGGGGSNVAGKKLHVHGGMTIGSNYAATSNPTNGLNVEGAIQQAGNQVLHAGNYNSYSPTLTGGGASGTWNINITGNAATATNSDQLDGYHASTTRNAANTVPVRDGNGYLQLGWINTTSGATTSINKIYASGDDYIRYVTPATFRSQVTDGSYVTTTYNTSLSGDSRNSRGVTRLYRRDDNSDYSVQTYWTGSYWRLYGYVGDSGHADTQVGYADNAGYASSAGNADTLDGLDSTAYLRDNGWNTSPGQDANSQPTMSDDFTYSNNAPHTGDLIRFGASGYSLQLSSQYSGSGQGFSFRTRNGDNGTWNPWYQLVHAGNVSSYAAAPGNYLPLAGGTMTGDIVFGTNDRDHSPMGTYDSTKTQQIWSMGAAYRNSNVGTNFGNLYGMAYKHTNNATGGTMAGGHQIVFVNNGTAGSAISMSGGMWTSGTSTAATFNATSTTNGGFQGIDADTAASPSFTWTADLDTGMYRYGTNNIGFTAGGNIEFIIYTSYTYSPGSSRAPIFYDSNNTAYYADLSSTGTSINAAGSIVAASDIRLKDNIETIPNALEKTLKLRGVTYTRKDGDNKSRQVGVIAQEVLEVLPEAVVDGPHLSVAYGNMVGLLIEAIKELNAQVEDLKRQLA